MMNNLFNSKNGIVIDAKISSLVEQFQRVANWGKPMIGALISLKIL